MNIDLLARPLAVLGMILVGGVYLACGTGDEAPVPKVPADQNLWRAAWDIATAEQRVALRDGQLTFTEYEAAALVTKKCIDDGGMQGEAVLNKASRTYEVAARWQSAGSRELDEPKRIESDRCYAEHWSGISQAWSAQSQPTQDQLYDARQALARCLRDAGHDVPDPAETADVQAFRTTDVFLRCAIAASETYGIPNFGG